MPRKARQTVEEIAMRVTHLMNYANMLEIKYMRQIRHI